MLAKIDTRPDSRGCIHWIGARHKRGYGNINIGNRVTKLSHRVIYEMLVGPIPKGLLVCHHCDTPSCVNPNHLFIGTQVDNMADMDAKGRRIVLRGERNRAKLKEQDIRDIRALAHSMPQIAIADRYGVSQTHISRIVRGISWDHVGMAVG
jgi:HNH endonuclease